MEFSREIGGWETTLRLRGKMAPSVPSYASTMKVNLAHALVKPTKEEGRLLVENLRKHE